MKIIYFISLFILISIYNSSVNAQRCANCLKENQSCSKDLNFGSCESGTFCPHKSQVCTSYIKEGEKCDKDFNYCIPGKRCLEDVDGIYRCIDHSFSNFGEECTLDSDCSTYQLSCIKGVCKLITNQTCNSDDGNCQYNEYCKCPSTGCYCTPIKTEGESCSSTDKCLPGLFCISSICTKFATPMLGIGSPCTFSVECNFNDGLYCSNRICQEFVEPKSTSCTPNTTSTNQCSEYQSCSCSDGTCYQTSPYPPEEIQLVINNNLKQCAYDNGCALGNYLNYISSESCVSKNCRKLICEKESQDYVKQKGDDCGRDAFELDLYCNSSIKITQSIASILIILLITFSLIF
ncbi:hypothetical protein RB653_008107 [Dictyostelium firmibasis]|uniref:Dickkopf N-terminal cysteine-rich domain-containing protein n=1 Tax=Dictyostelium firmibasis TaxID=79012 RepID=A0AAN7YTR8_9MYCE